MDAEARTQSPGWYADPDRPDGLRYWDGEAWTDRRRDRPGWIDGAPVEPRPPRSTKRIFAILAIIGVVLTAFVWFTVPKRPARTVSDRAFLAQAAKICAPVVPPLRAERKPERKLSDEEVADRIDEVADELTTMVAKLKTVPVAAADEAKVAVWLANWDKYIAVGRRYAESIREGDASAAEEVRTQGDDADRALGRFASGNRVDSCIPFSLG